MGKLVPTPFKQSLADKAKFLPLTLSSFIAEKAILIIYNQVEHAVSSKTEIDSESIKEKVLSTIRDFVKNESECFQDCLAGDISFFYAPKIEGGDDYNLNCGAANENQNFVFDTLKCSIGINYKDHCVHLTRTLMINPSEQTRQIYYFVLLVEMLILTNLVHGMKLSYIFEDAITFAENQNPYLAKYLDKEFGHSLSLDLKDELMIINSNSKGIAKENMVFAINVNLIGLQGEGKLFNFFNSNTALVKKDLKARIVTDYGRYYVHNIIRVENN